MVAQREAMTLNSPGAPPSIFVPDHALNKDAFGQCKSELTISHSLLLTHSHPLSKSW